jgi:quinol monooxygenase YgiN
MAETNYSPSVVVAEFVPADGKVDQLLAALGKAREASRAEDGCVSYELYQDTRNAGRWVMIEVWRDEGVRQTHLTTPHVADFRQTVPPLLKQPMTVSFLSQPSR